MSNEAADVEKAHKERDDLRVEVSRLQLEVKGPKTKLARKNIKTLHVFRNGIRHRPCGLFEVTRSKLKWVFPKYKIPS